MDMNAGLDDDVVVVRKLGMGSMGEVRLAHIEELGGLVALKSVGACDDIALAEAKLKREARALRQLDHPGIVRYLGTLTRHGRLMVAQEYVEGITLRRWFNRLLAPESGSPDLAALLEESQAENAEEESQWLVHGLEETGDLPPDAEDAPPPPLPLQTMDAITSTDHIRRCCELVRQAAAALGHAHERTVRHRDLKPENLMIDRQGHIRIIDFGIARYHGALTLSQTREILGSPYYMSPEAITGRINVTERSDVFSLGIVLYEALTLRTPYAARTLSSLFREIVARPAPPVSWKNPAVPRDLEAVVHKAIAKDPADRYATGGEFEQDLARFLAGKPVEARPYRYKPDHREIAAGRPLGVTLSAFLCLFMSMISFLVLLNDLDIPWDAAESTLSRIRNPSMYFLFTIVLLSLGRGLLHANRATVLLMPWVAAITSILSCGLFLVLLTWPNPTPFAFGVILFIISCGVYAAGSMWSKEGRRWAREAHAIRREQKRAPASAR